MGVRDRDVTGVVQVSEELTSLVSGALSRRRAVAALALALGRACALAGVSLDAAVLLVRVGRDEEDVLLYLRKAHRALLEELPS